jgi:hypothetical protein
MPTYIPSGNVRRKSRKRSSHPDAMDFGTVRQNLNSVVAAPIKGKGDQAVKGVKVGGTRLRGASLFKSR